MLDDVRRAPPTALRVLVVLPRDLDAVQWAERFARGEVPDATPYGYHFAAAQGCELSFAHPTPTWRGWAGLFDKAVRKCLGFDLRHVWANRELVTSKRFDVVWTHTEYEHLAISLLRKCLRRPTPPLIAQSIWLMDGWPRWSWARRCLYRWLMSEAEVATFHSPLNTEQARAQQLAQRVELVPFGISLDSFPLGRDRPVPADRSSPIRVLALGNDRHRDWATLASALGDQARFDVRVGSSRFPASLLRPNIHAGALSQQQVMESYAWADCVVVPLHANLHASGFTALLEAVAMQVPVVIARAGGLPHYFGEHEVSFYPVGQADDLRRSVEALMALTPTARAEKTKAAQRKLVEQQLSSEGFALRHVSLSLELTSPRTVS